MGVKGHIVKILSDHNGLYSHIFHSSKIHCHERMRIKGHIVKIMSDHNRHPIIVRTPILQSSGTRFQSPPNSLSLSVSRVYMYSHIFVYIYAYR